MLVYYYSTSDRAISEVIGTWLRLSLHRGHAHVSKPEEYLLCHAAAASLYIRKKDYGSSSIVLVE